MDALSAAEVKVLNNITDVRNSNVNLGDKLQLVIASLPAFIAGTPRNAVNASKLLTLTGVVVDGEGISIGTDIYEFLADDAQTKSLVDNIAVDITSHTVKATDNLTLPTQPTSGDTMTIGTKVYTFVPDGTDNADGEVTIGTDLATAQVAIVAAVNGTDDHNLPHPDVTIGDFSAGNVAAVTAKVGGTAGNNIVTTETFTAVDNVFSAVKLATGADCSAANACAALITAITASDTVGVGATAGEGTTVSLTADVAGVSGNNIAIAEDLANGSFAGGATALSGGGNGTVGVLEKPMVDGDYLYVCPGNNTIADKNWRRISLGAAF